MRIEIRPPSGLVPLLMTLPLVHALRHGYPEAELALAAAPEFQSLLALTGVDVRRAARRGRPRHDAVRLDLEALSDIRSRTVAGFTGRPLWRAFLAAALDAGLHCRALPRPPYLRSRGIAAEHAVLAVGPGKTGTALRSLAGWLQGRGERVEEVAVESVATTGAVGRTVRQVAGRRLVLSDSPEVTFLAAAFNVPVLSILPTRRAPQGCQPFRGRDTVLVVSWKRKMVSQRTLREKAWELLESTASVPGDV